MSVQHGFLAGLERGGVFQRCVTVLGMTPGLVAITGSAVVSRGYAMHVPFARVRSFTLLSVQGVFM